MIVKRDWFASSVIQKRASVGVVVAEATDRVRL